MEGLHNNDANIDSLVTNKMRIRLIMVSALMASGAVKIIDVKVAFFHE